MMNATKETNQDLLKMNKDEVPESSNDYVEHSVEEKKEVDIKEEKPKPKRKRKVKKVDDKNNSDK